MANLSKRMRAAKRLKLYGGLLSSVSSTGVISALALSDRTAALAMALLGFMTSVLTLVGVHADAPLSGARKNLGELTLKVLDIEREVKEQTLLLCMSSLVELAATTAAARKANELAAKLRVLEVIEGLQAAEPRGTTPDRTATEPGATQPVG